MVLDAPRRRTAELTDRLDDALSAKMLGVLRCRRHHFMVRRSGAMHAVDMFLAHSNLEQSHADLIAGRIVELGGEPGFLPASMAGANAVASRVREARLLDLAQEGLEAARLATAMLGEIAGGAGSCDPATRKLLKSIIDGDRAKAAELRTLIASLDAR